MGMKDGYRRAPSMTVWVVTGMMLILTFAAIVITASTRRAREAMNFDHAEKVCFRPVADFTKSWI